MLLETYTGDFLSVTRRDIIEMNRDELQDFLEARGFAVYDDESTGLLRETALEDFENEGM
jgi:hypothetical protein|tara:strand:- start:3802 stop:3981 length:180 start_codon:yes stop_codon:yes gene_type:complete